MAIAKLPTHYDFETEQNAWKNYAPKKTSLLLIDQNVFAAYEENFLGWHHYLIPSGETSKSISLVADILQTCINLKLDKACSIVGIGGGVVTDIASFVAAIYLRGVRCFLVPTTLLAMVDAAIGGKCGVNMGMYKNSVGVIKQPERVMYDYHYLRTLPPQEWSNGMAEIIKHAYIADAPMISVLARYSLQEFQQLPSLKGIIQSSAFTKIKIIQKDPLEKGIRKWLNFGHSIGHAIENTFNLPHGAAVAIGMVSGAYISEHYFAFEVAAKMKTLLQQYGLPTSGNFGIDAIMDKLSLDKKKAGSTIDFILLQRLGKAIIHPIKIADFPELLKSLPNI